MKIIRQSNFLEKYFSLGSRLRRAKYNYKDTLSYYRKEGENPEKSISKYRKDLEQIKNHFDNDDVSNYVDFDDKNNKIIYKNAIDKNGKPVSKTYKDKKRYEFEKSELKKNIEKEKDKYNNDKYIDSEIKSHMDKLSHPKKAALKSAIRGLRGESTYYNEED